MNLKGRKRKIFGRAKMARPNWLCTKLTSENCFSVNKWNLGKEFERLKWQGRFGLVPKLRQRFQR